jgi:hypothetical protein
LTWAKAGLKSQVVKNRIFVQPCARESWTTFLMDTPRSSTTSLEIHDAHTR